MKNFISAIIVGALTIPLSSAAANSASVDGEWSVLIVTEKGNCDRAYRYPVRIRNGSVSYGGSNNFTVSGSVNSNGATKVMVSKGEYSAMGTGTLRGKYGKGTWQAPAAQCSGRWTADRRG
ncbi:hypothetical protein [Terrihabitans sp. B22-R8]|uniref:hypothetical protein n=1 Tax=Terrihabitans sp. B22-R8 TaxID=3425128 RepID=UPI00403D126E